MRVLAGILAIIFGFFTFVAVMIKESILILFFGAPALFFFLKWRKVKETPKEMQPANGFSQELGKHRVWDNKYTIPLVVIVVILAVFVGRIGKSTTPAQRPTLTSNGSASNSVSATSEPTDALQEVTQTDSTQAEEIKKILTQCGVKVVSIQHDESLDGFIDGDKIVDVFGYRIESNKAKNVILYLNEDKSVYAVRYADETMYKDGNLLMTLTQILNRPDLELIGETTNKNDGYALYIEGTIKNNTSKTYSYIQVSFGVYDKDNNKVGTAFDNINNLGAGETWKFKAVCLASLKGGGTYKLDEITGY